MPATLTDTPQGWLLRTPPDEGVDGVVEFNPDLTLNETTIPPLYQALRTWADENSLQLAPIGWTSVRWVPWLETQFWAEFIVVPNETPNNESVLGAITCQCGAQYPLGSLYCGNCTRFLLCLTCRVAGVALYGHQCARCAPICVEDNCDTRVSVGDGNPRCATCDPRENCSNCSDVTATSRIVAFTQPEGVPDAGRTYRLCPVCIESICANCNAFRPGRRSAVQIDGEERRVCVPCTQAIYNERRGELERWEADELPVNGSLVIPSTDERPTRTISFELEFDGNGSGVASALYTAGLIQGPEVGRYSEQGRQDSRFPCILKRDASVSGGELVTYLIDLNNENHAAALLRMTEVMKGARDSNLAEFSSRTGGHVHMDLHGLSYHDLWVMFTLFRYLELPLYYMAGAGHDYSHRSLQGSNYANPANIGPFNDLAGFWSAIRRTGRTGLHFDNFVYALNNCACGHANIGRPENCRCDLGKATAEWRLWNAQITPRILHGWFALMQSLMAYSTNKEESFNEGDFPYLPWSQRRFTRLNTSEVQGIKDRLTWIFRELPLTSDERDSVLYVCKASELRDLGEEFFDELLNVQPSMTIEVKKKAKATARTQTFNLQPVEVPVTAFDSLENESYDDEDYYEDDEY